MLDINKVILVGRLGADPIVRQTKTGKSVTHFSVATSRRILKENTESEAESKYQEETQWHQVVAWGKQGEACKNYLKKGQPVYVEGYLKSRKYESKTGESRMNWEIQSEEVSFLSEKRNTEVVPGEADVPIAF